MAEIHEKCQEICANSTGLDKQLNVSAMMTAFEELGPDDVVAFVRRDTHVSTAIVVIGAAVALSMAALSVGARRFRRARSTCETNDLLDEEHEELHN